VHIVGNTQQSWSVSKHTRWLSLVHRVIF